MIAAQMLANILRETCFEGRLPLLPSFHNVLRCPVAWLVVELECRQQFVHRAGYTFAHVVEGVLVNDIVVGRDAHLTSQYDKCLVQATFLLSRHCDLRLSYTHGPPENQQLNEIRP